MHISISTVFFANFYAIIEVLFLGAIILVLTEIMKTISRKHNAKIDLKYFYAVPMFYFVYKLTYLLRAIYDIPNSESIETIILANMFVFFAGWAMYKGAMEFEKIAAMELVN